MKVLTVFSHPRRQSLSGAVLDAFADGLRTAGHEVEIADLHGEGFDPVMTPADEPDWSDSRKRYSDAVLREQARIARNDALAFVFPVWWWSLPAMLKGWFDRVWAKDIAFTLRDGCRITPLMTHIRKIGIVTTCGAPRWWSWIVGQPGRRTILRGIRALCARRCKTMYLAHYLMDASTPETRAAFLGEVRRRVGKF
jgi:putative NADPH-quinone reductase